jgi:hypothetical protein
MSRPGADFFDQWVGDSDNLRDCLDRLRDSTPRRPFKDTAELGQRVYRWYRREHDGLGLTVAECADVAEYFLDVAQLVVAAAGRLSGASQSTMQHLEGLRDDPRAAAGR